MLASLTDPIATRVAAHCGVPVAQVRGMFAPPKGVAADIALPCFQLAKAKGMPPPAMATELVGVLAGSGVDAVATGPFLNLTFRATTVATTLIGALAADPTRAVRATSGVGKTLCIDFSSPNIAKHLAFHHIRSTMLGNALAHCYEAAGWKVVRINFLGDWGTAFGRLIAGWKREKLTLDQMRAAPDQVTFLNELYVRISKAAKDDPAVEAEARHWSKKLEDGDAEARELWQIFKAASLAEFQKVYDLLGVRFDSWKGEAHYEDKMGPLLAELDQRGLTKIDDGATIVDLTSFGITTPALIKRGDGGTLYATRDLTACDDRWREYQFDRSLYVVDLGQSLHFKQWFAIAKLLERSYAERLRHIGFGLVLMWSDEKQTWERSATRRGMPMMLTDVLAESVERAAAIVAEKNPELPAEERAQVARAVGVGAVVFNDLKSGRTNDVKFKFEEALRFDGETGPYLQFAHARLCSIERKHRDLHPSPPAADPALLARDDEKAVLLAVARLQPALERVLDSDEPSVLATALLNLAGAVSSWLTAGNADVALRVLCPDPATASARLALVRVARGALGEGLRVLGLKAPERM